MTTPISTPVARPLTTPTTPTPAASDGLDKDAFMKLLVAQLKYQNPMAPADGQQHMSQMAVFAQVEKLEQLVAAQREQAAWQQRVSAEGMVGRSVTALDATDTEVSGTVMSVQHRPGGSVLVLADGTEVAPESVTRVSHQG